MVGITQNAVVRANASHSIMQQQPRLHSSDLDLEFIGMLVHELRNGLTSIRLLRRAAERASEPSVPCPWTAIEEAVDRMWPLIQDMLEFCRLAHRSFHVRFQRIDLRDIGPRVANEGRLALFKSRGVTFDLDLFENPVWVLGDPDRLTMACENLLDNALKHTAAAGIVRLGIKQSAVGPTISVSDTGAGIDPSFLNMLFEPFACGDSVPAGNCWKSTDRGMGLGLLFVRTVAEMHGGRISAHSQGPGRGAQFILALPRQTC